MSDSNFESRTDAFLESSFPSMETSVYRDLSLNFKKLTSEGLMTPQERWMITLAVATSLNYSELAKMAVENLKSMDLSKEQIHEASQVAGIMGMNNVYYKFKTFLAEEAKEHYSRAGLRMQSLMKPLVGKATFELLSLAVSVVNGCPTCVSSHERALVGLGMEPDRIHDSVRLAAVIKGLHSLKSSVAVSTWL